VSTRDLEADLLIEAIENLQLEWDSTAKLRLPKGHPVQVVQSSTKVDVLNHPAIKYIHSDVNGNAYLKNLIDWAHHSVKKISNGQSEISSGLPKGDLYSNFGLLSFALYHMAHIIDSVSNIAGRNSRCYRQRRQPARLRLKSYLMRK
jgi:hypothetical protein